MGYQEPKVKIS